MKKIVSAILLSAIIYSCSNNSNSGSTGADTTAAKPALDKMILGEWHNTTLKVKINTALNSDSTGFIDVDESNWERVLKTKPMMTTFSDDGSYKLTYGASDSSVTASAGTWYVVDDTIFMNQKQPDNTFFQYMVSVKDNMVTLTGLVDWEGDGKVDDEYSGTLKK